MLQHEGEPKSVRRTSQVTLPSPEVTINCSPSFTHVSVQLSPLGRYGSSVGHTTVPG